MKEIFFCYCVGRIQKFSHSETTPSTHTTTSNTWSWSLFLLSSLTLLGSTSIPQSCYDTPIQHLPRLHTHNIPWLYSPMLNHTPALNPQSCEDICSLLSYFVTYIHSLPKHTESHKTSPSKS